MNMTKMVMSILPVLCMALALLDKSKASRPKPTSIMVRIGANGLDELGKNLEKLMNKRLDIKADSLVCVGIHNFEFYSDVAPEQEIRLNFHVQILAGNVFIAYWPNFRVTMKVPIAVNGGKMAIGGSISCSVDGNEPGHTQGKIKHRLCPAAVNLFNEFFDKNINRFLATLSAPVLHGNMQMPLTLVSFMNTPDGWTLYFDGSVQVSDESMVPWVKERFLDFPMAVHTTGCDKASEINGVSKLPAGCDWSYKVDGLFIPPPDLEKYDQYVDKTGIGFTDMLSICLQADVLNAFLRAAQKSGQFPTTMTIPPDVTVSFSNSDGVHYPLYFQMVSTDYGRKATLQLVVKGKLSKGSLLSVDFSLSCDISFDSATNGYITFTAADVAIELGFLMKFVNSEVKEGILKELNNALSTFKLPAFIKSAAMSTKYPGAFTAFPRLLWGYMDWAFCWDSTVLNFNLS